MGKMHRWTYIIIISPLITYSTKLEIETWCKNPTLKNLWWQCSFKSHCLKSLNPKNSGVTVSSWRHFTFFVLYAPCYFCLVQRYPFCIQVPFTTQKEPVWKVYIFVWCLGMTWLWWGWDERSSSRNTSSPSAFPASGIWFANTRDSVARSATEFKFALITNITN